MGIGEEVRHGHDTGTVLLVDDNSMVRVMTTEMLEAIGYTVVATGSPVEALSYFDDVGFRVDLVITDVMMPLMNGRELAESIAEMRPGACAEMARLSSPLDPFPIFMITFPDKPSGEFYK